MSISHEYQTLHYSIENFAAVITINRPEKLNALSSHVLDDLRHLVTDLRVRDDVRVVIITGSGEKAFVAGADIGELAALNNHEIGREFAQNGQAVFSLIESSPKPFIAAVNGFALGGGSAWEFEPPRPLRPGRSRGVDAGRERRRIQGDVRRRRRRHRRCRSPLRLPPHVL